MCLSVCLSVCMYICMFIGLLVKAVSYVKTGWGMN